MHTIYQFILWSSVLLLVALIVPTCLEACPACKNLDEPIGRGFNSSIFFMMAMPFTVFALVGGSVFYHYRRANRKGTDQETI